MGLRPVKLSTSQNLLIDHEQKANSTVTSKGPLMKKPNKNYSQNILSIRISLQIEI